MNEWWSWQTAIWIGSIGGGGLGSIGGVFGGIAGTLAPRGIARGPVLAIHALLILLGVAALIAGIVALTTGQPWHVTLPLGGIGVVLAGVMGPLYPVVRMRYAQAEARRLEAEQFRRG